MPSADTPGVPPKDVPRPDEDLHTCAIMLDPGSPHQDDPPVTIVIYPLDYAAGGRIFKWLQGQMALAREAHGG
jgi:hypothetical protein